MADNSLRSFLETIKEVYISNDLEIPIVDEVCKTAVRTDFKQAKLVSGPTAVMESPV
jgi:hypothetical protein